MPSEARLAFAACDTTWLVQASGEGATDAANAARETVLDLERQLNAFDPASPVARLNRTGQVTNAHVARLVRRASEYGALTQGAFDIGHGSFEHALKAHLRGAHEDAPRMTQRARWRVEGDTVTTDAPLDLNGIAKGYIVDRAREALVHAGASGFVDGGGDIAGPTGPVSIESPYDATRTLGTLDTRWNVATSGSSRRRRGPLDHLYDPRARRAGSRHDQVTVVARRDCVEADVLATTLAILTLEEGNALIERLPGVEALWVDKGTLRASRGFSDHVWKA